MDSAGAHQRRDLIDDLTTVAMTAAKASPATALSRSADIARTEAIERIAKTLAKIGYIREGCAAAAEIPIEGVRAVCNKEIADGLLQEGKATEARAIIATIEKSALRFSGVISIAKDLARRGDVGAGLSELNVVEDPGLRVNGVQGIANTLAAGSADDKAYRRVLEELASACAQADRMIPVEDWFFDTMSQAMAEAGKTEDILRLVDRIPPESERADDFKNAVLIDAADTLIDHGHTDGLDRLIAALGDPESRDHRRRRWAVHVAEHQGYQDAEGIMATITDSSIRTRAKSEMVMGFLSEDRPADAVHVAEIIGPDESSGYGGDRDDAFNNIVTYYVTKGDVAAATRAAEQVHRPWYRAWSLARLGKAHVACGHVERGQDLFRQSICLAQRIRDQWQQENLIKFCCREYGKWADVDFLASALRKMRDIGHMTDAAIAVAMFCHRHQKPDMALTILGETAQRTQGRRTKGAAFDALRGVIRAYAAIGADATARELIRSLGNGGKQKTLVQLLEESHQPVGDAPALPDPMTMDAWSSIIKAVEQVGAGGERIAACRRILDEPSVRTSKAFRDHVAQIAVRAFRGLTPDEKREERIGLITTLVECGCRNLAAKIFRQIRDREEDFLFGKFIAVLAEGVRDSDAPFEWVAFAGTLDIQPSVRKAEVLQSAAFQLGQRRKGDPAAAVEMIRNLDEVPLPPDALATAYASSHMALAKCGSRDLRHLTGSMLRTARNPRLARSSVLCMMTILVRSGEYAEAKRLADMCPELGLMGVFSG
jgi:hypothetical protein